MRVVPADRPDLTDHEFHFSEQPDLSEELRMLREQVRRFVEKEVVPHGEQWERDGMIPREIFRRMGALGFLGMRHEAEYGGTEMGPLASMVFAEELGRSTFGGFTSSTLVHSDMSAVHIMLRGTPYPYLPQYIVRFDVTADGKAEPVTGLPGDLPALNYVAQHPGLQVIAQQTVPYRVTYEDWELFRKYVTEEGFPEIEGEHLKRGLPTTGFTERYTRYVKALVQAGPPRPGDRDVRTGLPFGCQ